MHLKQNDRQLSGQQLVKAVQSDQNLNSGLQRLWHPYFRTRMVFCSSTILRLLHYYDYYMALLDRLSAEIKVVVW